MFSSAAETGISAGDRVDCSGSAPLRLAGELLSGSLLTGDSLAGVGAPASGLLLLASEDPQRFYSGMGPLVLERLGELISAALGSVPANVSTSAAAAT